MDESATIQIRRDSPKDIKIRGLEILLDDKRVANLKYGQSVSLKVCPGSHVLKVTNSLYSKSEAFSLEAGETAHFSSR